MHTALTPQPAGLVSFPGRRGSQVVRSRSAKPLFAGSIPAPASNKKVSAGGWSRQRTRSRNGQRHVPPCGSDGSQLGPAKMARPALKEPADGETGPAKLISCSGGHPARIPGRRSLEEILLRFESWRRWQTAGSVFGGIAGAGRPARERPGEEQTPDRGEDRSALSYLACHFASNRPDKATAFFCRRRNKNGETGVGGEELYGLRFAATGREVRAEHPRSPFLTALRML